MKRQLLLLEPICTHNVWGGTRLREDFGYDIEGNDIGECWGISAHPKGDCVVQNGEFAGMKLSEVWEKHPEFFGNIEFDRFPLLIKIIEAKDDLSIQVHPGDDYAMEHENGSFGKAECWYILDCEPNATLVMGHNARTKNELVDMIENGRWKDFIREIPVKKGDFIQIDPGTVHAIKGGILLLETQQNSDITYRVYDYDRLVDNKPRELHVQQSIDVITVPAILHQESIQSLSGNIEASNRVKNQMNQLYVGKYYKVFRLHVDGKATFEQKYPFLNVSIVEGVGKISGISVKKGNHLIVPYGFGMIEIEGKMQIIASTV